MLRLVLGIGLMAVSFVLLFMFIQAGDNKLASDILTALTCNKGEHFTQELGNTIFDSSSNTRGREFRFYCKTETTQRDVTAQGILIGIAGFVVPFLLGLGLLLAGIFATVRSSIRRQTAGFSTPTFSNSTVQIDPFGQPIDAQTFRMDMPGQTRSSTVVTVNGQPGNLADLSPETAQMVQQMLGGLGTVMKMSNFDQQAQTPLQGDLTDKLQQLQEAKDKNLITQEEYDRMRKDILDQLS